MGDSPTRFRHRHRAEARKEAPIATPKKSNGNFFDLFEQAAANNIAAARLLDRVCIDFSDAGATSKEIHELEHRGDEIAHGIYEALNKVFIPPLDREDIIDITKALDDVMDHIYEAADAMCVYNIQKPTPVAANLAKVIVSCTESVAAQLPKLRSRRAMKGIAEGVIELHRLENEADLLLREGVMKLFHEPNDPVLVIAWSRIYETMEQVTDKCEDIADVLRGLTIKHA